MKRSRKILSFVVNSCYKSGYPLFPKDNRSRGYDLWEYSCLKPIAWSWIISLIAFIIVLYPLYSDHTFYIKNLQEHNGYRGAMSDHLLMQSVELTTSKLWELFVRSVFAIQAFFLLLMYVSREHLWLADDKYITSRFSALILYIMAWTVIMFYPFN